jgi:uncharacterized membrane protein
LPEEGIEQRATLGPQSTTSYPMKQLAIIACFALLSLAANAQTAPADTAKLNLLARQTQRYFNDNQVDSLYSLMGATFKQQISADKMREVTAQLIGQLGKWTSLEPRGVQEGIARYKATFAMAPLDFYLSRDKEGKIETFLFKPYQE